MSNPLWIDEFNEPLASSRRQRSDVLKDRQRQTGKTRPPDETWRGERRRAMEPVKSVRYDKEKD